MHNFIRTSRHSLKFSNKHKLEELNDFIKEYRRVSKLYLNYLWDNNFQFSYSKNSKITTLHFDSKTQLELPTMLSTVKINQDINLETTLSARALKCCITQVLSIVRGDVEKQRKRHYIISQLRSKSKKIPKKLRKATRINKPVKPDLSDLNQELNSICIDLKETNNHFDAFVRLKSFSTIRNKTINLPVQYHRNSNKWSKQGKRLNSFLITDKDVQIRYEIQHKSKKSKKSKVVGADQGLKDVVTLSDKQVTPKQDVHSHSLESITKKISRKKKGSLSFSKAQAHRKNFINYSINRLNLTDISELRLENIRNIRYKKRTSRYMAHWMNTLIRDKLKRRCEEEEVLLTLQSSAYRSQRCSECGLVRKSNRKSKVYLCKNCGLEIDADLNASLNHQQDLPDISFDLRKLNLNRKGFFWSSKGFYSLTGEELTVPLSKK